MKQFISNIKNLSQKAAEIKAAMQQVPPKVAEIREAVTATAGQLQQLKSEIQYSVADLKADQEDHLSEALQEINNSQDAFEKAGFALEGVDLELSPVQRLLVHLLRVEDVHTAVLRSLVQSNQHRRTTRAILSSLLQAKQMADTVEVDGLIYNEVVVGIGPIPSVRLCWRAEQVEPAPVIQSTPAIPVPPTLAASAPASPPSPFGASSFFERREAKTAPVAQPIAEATISSSPAIGQPPIAKAEALTETPVSNDPLARFKKMPDLMRLKR
jgi:hypothetical protein